MRQDTADPPARAPHGCGIARAPFDAAIERVMGGDRALAEINREAFARGAQAAEAQASPAAGA